MTGGLLGAAQEAVSYGANTFMIYTGAPRNARRSPLEKLKIEEGWAYMRENGIDSFVVHAPYIINLASFKEDTYNLAVTLLKDELERAKGMGSELVVLHPGAYTERDLEYGVNRIVSGFDSVLTDDYDGPDICLETMTGKGTEIGGSFEELKMIIDKARRKDKLKVCFDTCHAHDAGYAVSDDLDSVMDQFDEVLGLDMIEVFHLNGSLNPRGAKKDRHANIGATADNPKGADNIGFAAIRELAHSRYAEGRFLILETPWLDANTNLYKEEIAALRAGERD